MLRPLLSDFGSMNSGASLVTVGMPVYNCARTVGTAIRSLLKQTYGNWELLVIDDGSTDGTVCAALRFRDPRIHVLAGDQNRGIAWRLNEAVGLSRGKYFARMDGDDVCYPERLARQVAWLERHPDVDLLGGGVVVFRGEGEVLGTRAISLTHEQICRRPRSGFPLPHPTWIGRTEWFRNHPYHGGIRAEDQNLLLETYRSSRFAALPTVLLGYREESLRLKKILRGRWSFLCGTVRQECSQGRKVLACAAILEHAAKAIVEIAAISTGLDYAILRHRALSAPPRMVRRWEHAWAEAGGPEEKTSREPDRVAGRREAKLKILYAGTSPLSVAWFLRGQLGYLREAGFDVTVVTAPGVDLDEAREREGVRTIAVPMARNVALGRDLVALWRLCSILRRVRPSITNVGTPKAGLLAGVAAWLSGVPCRVYTLHGLRLETARGPKRVVLWLAEWLACHLAHRVLCVSESLRQKALALHLVSRERAVVLGAGSCNGVDETRYAPGPEAAKRARQLRRRLGIAPDAPVLGFIGRLTRDKGVPELIDCYSRLRRMFPGLRLILVGDFEHGDPIDPALCHRIETDPGIVRTGFLRNVVPYYHAADIVLLPTFREGFSNAVLEAHAAGKPVVATRATGVVDALTDGIDGLLVPVGDAAALAEAVERLLRDPALRSRMGQAGRERILRHFRQQDLWNRLLHEYVDLLTARGLPLPQGGKNAATDSSGVDVPALSNVTASLEPRGKLARRRRDAIGAP